MERAEKDAGLERIAESGDELFVGFDEATEDGVVHFLVEDQATSGGAALAGGSGAGEERRPDDEVDVGALVDDDGVVPAQFEQVAPESALDGDSDLPIRNFIERTVWD